MVLLMISTFFKPAYLRAGRDTSTAWFAGVLNDFEGFWDAEIPRIGEPGATGWSQSGSETATSPIAPPAPDSRSDPFEGWLEAERHAEAHLARPGRASDLDADDDDPYHIVLFSDVEPLLFPIQDPEVRLQLVYAFLHFLGLPFTPPDASTSSASASDPRLRWPLSQNAALRAAYWPPRQDRPALPWQTVGGEPMEPEHPKALRNPFGCPIKSWASDRTTLFGRPGQAFVDLESADLQHVDVELVRNVFAMLRPLLPDPAFTLASIAFESAASPKS